jgi:hypothetical protein
VEEWNGMMQRRGRVVIIDGDRCSRLLRALGPGGTALLDGQWKRDDDIQGLA